MTSRNKVILSRVAIVVIFLGVWEIGGQTGVIDVFFFPLPSSIIRTILRWSVSVKIYSDLMVTLLETIIGFVTGTLAGIVLGLWLALNPFASKVLDPFLKGFNAIPRMILVPIFTLWFGLGLTSKVAMVATLVLFIAFFNTYEGVRAVNPIILANARLLRARGVSLLRHIYIPSAAQWILSSLRSSIGFAVSGAVVAEYLGSVAGIGHLIAQAEGAFDAKAVFAGLAVLSVFVLALDKGVSLLERRVLVWQPRRSEENA